MKYSVVVISYNQPIQLQLLLDSFDNQKDSEGLFEIVLVDDGSFPPLESKLSLSRKYKISYLYLPRNSLSCRARARNAGAELAHGEYLVFLDGDSLVNPFYIKNYNSYFLSLPHQSFVLGSRTHLNNRAIQPLLFQSTSKTLDTIFVNNDIDEKFTIAERMNLPFHEISNNWMLFTSCNFCIESSVFKKIGMFNERFLGWGSEDTEFAYRAYQLGYKIDLIDNRVIHFPHLDNGENIGTRYVEWINNIGLFYRIHEDQKILLLMTFESIIYDCFMAGKGWDNNLFLHLFLQIQLRLDFLERINN